MLHLRLLILLISIFSSLHAFNHPEIKWKTVPTDHFTINYYDKTEPAVYATWKIAEDAYKSLSTIYDYQPIEKIAISLAEHDDYSNGFAEWTSGNIQIWLPDIVFDLRSNTTWLQNVITHELTHIMSMEQKRRHQGISFTINAAISTPNESYSLLEPLLQISEYPSWLAEGIAQFETEQMGNDCFDSRREMVLRCAVLSNTALSFDEMGNFNHDMIGNELVYNQGFAFIKYMARVIGIDKIRSILKKATYQKTDLLDEFYKTTGLSLNNLYSTWIDSLRTVYNYHFPNTQNNDRLIASTGSYNLSPKISPDGKYCAWFSSGKDEGERTDLIIATANEFKMIHRISYAHTSYCFSNTSQQIFYIKSRSSNRNGSYFNDLFVWDLSTGKERRITHDGRAYDVCPIPGSDDLLCICYNDNVFSLSKCDIRTGSFTRVITGEPGMPLIKVSVNPKNSSEFVIAKIVNGQSRLFLGTLQKDSITPFSPGNAQEESPHWNSNGRIYYSSDYDGTFNIFSILPNGSDLQKHTTTNGGYFSPQVLPDGTILASLYNVTGFSIVQITPASELYQIPEHTHCSFKNLPLPTGTVSIKSKAYESAYRRSSWEYVLFGQITKNNNLILNKLSTIDTTQVSFGAGFQRSTSDALHKKNKIIGLSVIGLQNSYDNQSSLKLKKNCRSQNEYLSNIDNCIPISVENRSVFQNITTQRLSCNSLLSNAFRLHQSESSTSDSTSELPSVILFSQPTFLIENNSSIPTYGLNATATLLYSIVPVNVNLTPYFQLQLAREWQCGAQLEFQNMPFNKLTGIRIPMFLSWSHVGYYNQDFTYNTSDLTQIEISAAPEFIPGYTVSNQLDTNTTSTKGLSAQLSLFHAFPLFKYSSFQLSSTTLGRFYDSPILDESVLQNSTTPSDILKGSSDCYIFSLNSANLVFPIANKIDTGSKNYFDALYGHLKYFCIGYFNSYFINSNSKYEGHLFTDPDYFKESFFLDHFISLGFQLGAYKSYFFFKQINFDLSFQLLRPSCSITLSSGL
jgi:hypothetical protein